MTPSRTPSRWARRTGAALALLLSLGSIPASLAAPAPRPRFDPERPLSIGLGTGDQRAGGAWTPRRLRTARPMRIDPDNGGRAPVSAASVRVEHAAGKIAGSAPTSPTQAASAPFTSYEITDPSVAPYITHGKLFTRFGDAIFVCSGTAIESANESIVWTAGHCVHEGGPGGSWVDAAAFVPGYRNGDAPAGVWSAVAAGTTAGWSEYADLHYDLGALVVAPNDSGETLTDVVGSRGFAWNQATAQDFRAFGYPAAPPFDGERAWVCESPYVGSDPNYPGSPATMAIGCDMTPGSSGGGWVIEDRYVDSVVSYGYDEIPDVIFGPYHGDDAYELLHKMDSGAEPKPVEHEVRVGLTLRRHLVARGTMTAADGYAPCTRAAPIKVSRRTSSGWKLVGRTTTDSTGAYRVTVPDRPGRYRVTSPPGVVDDFNTCSATVSTVARHSH